MRMSRRSKERRDFCLVGEGTQYVDRAARFFEKHYVVSHCRSLRRVTFSASRKSPHGVTSS